MSAYTLFHVLGGEPSNTDHGFDSREHALSFLTGLDFEVAALAERDGVTEIMARSVNGTAMHFRLVRN